MIFRNIFKSSNENKVDLSGITDNRIKKNCELLQKKGLPVDPNMNTVFNNQNIRIRSKEEIARYMIDEFIMAHRAASIMSNVPNLQDTKLLEHVMKYKPSQEVTNFLTESGNPNYDKSNIISIYYFYTRVWVFMYILGYLTCPLQDKKTFVQPIELKFENFKGYEDVVEKAKMISEDEILSFADLIDRYIWALNVLTQKGEVSKKIDRDIIIEQKEAMDYVLSIK